MANPYDMLGPDAFWRPAVGARNPLEIENLWAPRIALEPEDAVITAGSCFAQHIGRALKRNGFNWYDAEPGAGSSELRRKFGYGVFSFRTGNIYTVALLEQWLGWAFGLTEPSCEVWERDGRVFDPFRPAIEPDGFASAEEMFAARAVTLAAIRDAFAAAKTLVFTLGLTEGWVNRETGHAYPMCPGTVAGEFDPALHEFRNYRHAEIGDAMSRVIETVRRRNPGLQLLLTVSPVPLTATYSGRHVLVATTYSKSVLRAVAGELAEDHAGVDYFPSYEIITAPVFRGLFYQPNAREVSEKGVEHVMANFFAGLGVRARPVRGRERPRAEAVAVRKDGAGEGDVICEEAMLEAFGAAA